MFKKKELNKETVYKQKWCNLNPVEKKIDLKIQIKFSQLFYLSCFIISILVITLYVVTRKLQEGCYYGILFCDLEWDIFAF